MAQFAHGLLLQRKVEFEFLRKLTVKLRAPPAKDEAAPCLSKARSGDV
jgi:hypothetical protein